MRVNRYGTIDSTNLEACRLAEVGERGPLWIVADEQMSGKGRLGRIWISEPGNLYATLLLPLASPQVTYPQLGLVAALAVFDTARNFDATSSISLKWPNDCLLGGAKFCGVLVEVAGAGLVAIGIGMNIGHIPNGLPYPAARLAAPSVELVFEHLSLTLSNWLGIWSAGQGLPAILKAWEERCDSIGRPVEVDGWNGIFEGLEADGAMRLRLADGKTQPIYAGDVRVEYQASR